MNSTRKTISISFLTQYLELAIQFTGVIILARILTPSDTGTYSVAAFLMTLLHVFRDFGVVNYLIQEVDLTAEKIRSAMGVSIILALIVSLIMLLSSGVVAAFYNNAALKEILVVMAASFAISPFGSLLIGIYRRELQLKTIFFIRISSSICHVIVATTLAFAGYGALSLAWANFAGILVFGIVANLNRPKNMPWVPYFRNIRSILSFGGISSIGSAANTIGTNSPDLVIAKILDMASVGYFSRATGMVQLFTRLISSALTPLVLPFFAKIRRDGGDAAEPYLIAVNYLTALAWPFFAVLALLAFPMVNTLYGSQWTTSVPIVKLLCLAGAIGTLTLFASQVMVANGQVKSATYSQILTQPFKVCAVLFASSYGLPGIAIALIFMECVALFVVSWFLSRAIQVGLQRLFFSCKQSAYLTLFSVVGPFLIMTFWGDQAGETVFVLIAGIITAALGWLLGITLLKHPFLVLLLESLGHAKLLISVNTSIRENLKMRLKTQIKSLLYYLGIFSVFHKLRNRDQLTIVMFHRVLPRTDVRWQGADPEWTMSTETFEMCLKFFKKHYNVISMNQLATAMNGGDKLPNVSLLITFDDGWADTSEFAQALLEKFSLPALVFVAGEAVNQFSPFWQETVYSTLTKNNGGLASLNSALIDCDMKEIELSGKVAMTENDIRTVITKLYGNDFSRLKQLANRLYSHTGAPAAMLNQEQLQKLSTSLISIGSHGNTHQPLTKIVNPTEEILRAKHLLNDLLSGVNVDTMSFPHGAYDDNVLRACKDAGYKYLFSSDAILNDMNGNTDSVIFGRIHISERAITDKRRQFSPSIFAAHLFFREKNRVNTMSKNAN
ncbi:MAG: oligosaccharide flippase family protein [bacterium]|nr:oligosaccharide flippase family protein [bacterium]